MESLKAGVELPSGEIHAVSMLGSDEKIEWFRDDSYLKLNFPKEKPCKHAFVFKIETE